MSAAGFQRPAAHAWASMLLYGAAFCIPLSIVPTQLCLYGALLCWLIAVIGNPDAQLRFSPTIIWVAGFVICLVVCSVVGIDPARSLRKLHRFVLLGLIFAIPYLHSRRHECSPVLDAKLLLYFIAGACVLAVYDLIRIPLHVLQGRPYYEAGNMRDPQFYLVAMVLLVVYLMTQERSQNWVRKHRLPLMAFGLCLLAFFMHNKRGAWISFGFSIFVVSCLLRRFRILLGLVVAVALLIGAAEIGVKLGLPEELSPISRLGQIEDEFGDSFGGRVNLWKNVAPELIKEYPFGVGYKATSWKLFRAYNWSIANGIDHLHNNLLQITAELGWIGVACWVLWMLSALAACLRGPPEHKFLRVAVLGSLVGLLANGMVENNFGDSEIFMLYVLLLGLAELARVQR